MQRLAAVIAVVLFASTTAYAEQSKMPDPKLADADVRMIAPGLQKYRHDRVLGDVWKRPGLSPRDRSIATLAALIARNQTRSRPVTPCAVLNLVPYIKT